MTIILFVSSFIVYAQLITFEPNQTVKNEEFNHNFNHIRQLFLNKNATINFLQYNNQQIINKDSLENNFNVVRGLGINVTELTSNHIKSSEVNQAFIDMQSGALIFDDIPLSNNSLFSVVEDTLFNGNISVQNITGTISAQLISSPTNGILILNNNGSFSYTPNTNFNGSDSFVFRVSDGNNLSNTATVSLSISAVDDAPIANSSIPLSFNEDISTSVTLPYLDIEGDLATSCSITLFNNATPDGVCSCVGGICSIPIRSQLNYVGSGYINYTVTANGKVSNESTVSFTILPINDAPILNSLSLQTDINVIKTGFFIATDVDSSSFTYSVVSLPSNGILILNPSTGAYSYQPNLNYYGPDSFQIKANDGQVDSNILTVSIDVIGKGIINTAGIRTYFDGSFATSCNQYKNQVNGSKIYQGATGDGTYRIQNGANIINVTCDMTTSGGGWTKLIGSTSETSSALQTYIQSIASTNQLVGGTWTNNGYGLRISGTTGDAYSCIVYDKTSPFREIMFDYTSFYNSPSTCAGHMQVATSSSVLVATLDAWSNSIDGQIRTLNDVSGGKSRTDYINTPYSRTFTTDQTGLQVCFHRYAPSTYNFPQCTQAFRNMYVR